MVRQRKIRRKGRLKPAAKKALGGAARGTWRGIKTISRIAHEKYELNLDRIVQGASLLAADSAIRGYTGLPLYEQIAMNGWQIPVPDRPLVTAAALAGGWCLEKLVDRYIPETGISRKSKALRAAALGASAIAANVPLTLALEDHVAADLLTIGSGAWMDSVEMAVLTAGAYGLFKGAGWAGNKVQRAVDDARSRWTKFSSLRKKATRRLAKTAIAGLATLTLASSLGVADSLNPASYDGITHFRKEGIVEVDESKLPVPLRRDALGRYAEVELGAGESIYSKVLEYTDRLSHSAVLGGAEDVLARSYPNPLDRPDFTQIPAGAKLKIPIDLLAHRYSRHYEEPRAVRPREGAPVEATAATSTLELEERVRPSVRASSDSLKGKHIILDAGHGGHDPGNKCRGLRENEIAYDLMVRHMLEVQRRGAEVYPIVRDNKTGYHPQSSLIDNTDEVILTTPPYLTADSAVAANLRSYKSAALYRDLVSQGVAPEDIVMVSWHTNSLDDTGAEGMMVIIPGADHRNDGLKRGGRTYNKYHEVREVGEVKMHWRERARSEALSHTIADLLIEEAKSSGVPVFNRQPVRNVIQQSNGSKYVPVPIDTEVLAAILIETGNACNERDAERFVDPAYRQRVAEVAASALERFYVNGGGEHSAQGN